MTATAPAASWRCAFRALRAWMSRELGPYRSIVSALVVYGVLRIVFAHVVGSGGFATPGSLDRGLAAFALVMLVMRITILVGVPLVVTYRLVHRLFALARRRDGRARPDEAPAAPVATPTAARSTQPTEPPWR